LIQLQSGIESRTTVIDWYNFMHKECEIWLCNNPDEVGGQPIVAEIDESKYFHRKYHCGQWQEGH